LGKHQGDSLPCDSEVRVYFAALFGRGLRLFTLNPEGEPAVVKVGALQRDHSSKRSGSPPGRCRSSWNLLRGEAGGQIL